MEERRASALELRFVASSHRFDTQDFRSSKSNPATNGGRDSETYHWYGLIRKEWFIYVAPLELWLVIYFDELWHSALDHRIPKRHSVDYGGVQFMIPMTNIIHIWFTYFMQMIISCRVWSEGSNNISPIIEDSSDTLSLPIGLTASVDNRHKLPQQFPYTSWVYCSKSCLFDNEYLAIW